MLTRAFRDAIETINVYARLAIDPSPLITLIKDLIGGFRAIPSRAAASGEIAGAFRARERARNSRDDSRPRERRIAVFQRAGNREAAAHYEIGDITGGSCIPGGIMGARSAEPRRKMSSLCAASGLILADGGAVVVVDVYCESIVLHVAM